MGRIVKLSALSGDEPAEYGRFYRIKKHPSLLGTTGLGEPSARLVNDG
jgi:hypothetical protein